MGITFELPSELMHSVAGETPHEFSENYGQCDLQAGFDEVKIGVIHGSPSVLRSRLLRPGKNAVRTPSPGSRFGTGSEIVNCVPRPGRKSAERV